jgi:atypical dual specificity phosphatase
MGFPRTLLAYVLFPLWLFKRWLLYRRRAFVLSSDVHHWFDEVDPSLVVGGALFPGDLEALKAKGVGAILNCCAEYLDDEDACARADVSTRRVAILDDFWIYQRDLEAGVAWIDARVAEGRKVYVHCAAGRGRSVSVATVWLARRHGIAAEEALKRIQKERRAANPTPWQMFSVRRAVAAKARAS